MGDARSEGPQFVEPQFVEVVGKGTAETVSDLLQVHLGAQSRADSVGEAFDRANVALGSILVALRAHGVADDDLRSSEISLHPDLDKDGASSGYRASMGVAVTLRDLAGAGGVLAAAVEAGGDASRVHGLALLASGAEGVSSSAREAAWADAAARAGQYAALAGRSLGTVLSMRELGSPDSPLAGSAGMAFAGAHLQPGTQTVRASIAVRWELVDPR